MFWRLLNVFLISISMSSSYVFAATEGGLAGICSELLIHVQLESDSRVIGASIFQALTVDYPLLYNSRVNSFILDRLDRLGSIENGDAERDYHISTHKMGSYPRTRYPTDQDFLAKHLVSSSLASSKRLRRMGPVGENALADLVSDSVWKLIQEDFSGSDDKLEALYPEIPVAHFGSLRFLLEIITRNQEMTKAVLSFIAEAAIHADTWWPHFYDFKLHTSPGNLHTVLSATPTGRPKIIRKLLGRRLKNIIPTKVKLPTQPLDLEKERVNAQTAKRPEFSRLNANFSQPLRLGEGEDEGLSHFDRALRRDVQLLKASLTAYHDDFLQSPRWLQLFETARNLLRSEGDAAKISQRQFRVLVLLAQDLIDLQLRTLGQSVSSTLLAEENAQNGIRLLQQTPVYHTWSETRQRIFLGERTDASNRLAGIATDLSAVRGELQRRMERLSEAETLLHALEPLQASPDVRLRDPGSFRARMEEFQRLLGIDPVLVKRLEEKRFPWF